MDIAVIDAGIGGLATAIALQQQGHKVHVFETAAQWRPVGAGLWLAPNGQEVLQRLKPELLAQALAQGFVTREALIMTHTGQVLTRLEAEPLQRRYGHVPTLAIHRAALHQILHAALTPGTVHCGHRFRAFEARAERVQIHFEKAETVSADLLIGADGLHSPVRRQLFGDLPLRYSGQTCWRGLSPAPLSETWRHRSAEIWGPAAGLRVGFSPLADQRTYFYITALANAGERAEISKAMLLRLLTDFPAEVQEMVAQTPVEQIMRHDLYDLPPLTSYHRGRVVLLGDAAHATTPNLGQGANQALESAWVLADCLQQIADLEPALVRYEQVRIPKATQVVQRSWQINQMVNVSQPWLRHCRNFVVKHLPASLQLQQFDRLYHLV